MTHIENARGFRAHHETVRWLPGNRIIHPEQYYPASACDGCQIVNHRPERRS